MTRTRKPIEARLESATGSKVNGQPGVYNAYGKMDDGRSVYLNGDAATATSVATSLLAMALDWDREATIAALDGLASRPLRRWNNEIDRHAQMPKAILAGIAALESEG